jgi:hypothetical protein
MPAFESTVAYAPAKGADDWSMMRLGVVSCVPDA